MPDWAPPGGEVTSPPAASLPGREPASWPNRSGWPRAHREDASRHSAPADEQSGSTWRRGERRQSDLRARYAGLLASLHRNSAEQRVVPAAEPTAPEPEEMPEPGAPDPYGRVETAAPASAPPYPYEGDLEDQTAAGARPRFPTPPQGYQPPYPHDTASSGEWSTEPDWPIDAEDWRADASGPRRPPYLDQDLGARPERTAEDGIGEPSGRVAGDARTGSAPAVSDVDEADSGDVGTMPEVAADGTQTDAGADAAAGRMASAPEADTGGAGTPTESARGSVAPDTVPAPAVPGPAEATYPDAPDLPRRSAWSGPSRSAPLDPSGGPSAPAAAGPPTAAGPGGGDGPAAAPPAGTGQSVPERGRTFAAPPVPDTRVPIPPPPSAGPPGQPGPARVTPPPVRPAPATVPPAPPNPPVTGPVGSQRIVPAPVAHDAPPASGGTPAHPVGNLGDPGGRATVPGGPAALASVRPVPAEHSHPGGPVAPGAARPAAVAGGVPSLPQRVPGPPDVPQVPGPDPLPGAPRPPGQPRPEPGELARIATYLRDDGEEPPPAEPFDVTAVLAAVRGVAGVRDARLRADPSGVHTLRLDLADGADPGHVSRTVARLLGERMGLAAEPRHLDPGPGWRDAPEATRPDLGPREAARPDLGPREAARPEPVPVADPVGGSTHDAVPAAVSGPEAVPAAESPQVTVPAPAAVVSTPPAADPAPAASASPAAAAASPDERAVSAPAEPAGRPPYPESGWRTSRGEVLAPATVPAQRAVPRDASGSERFGRLVLDQVLVSTLGPEATVEVRLTAGAETSLGVATGPSVDAYMMRLAAVAASSALDKVLATQIGPLRETRCFIEHAGVVPFGTCEVAVVVVLLVSAGVVEQLTGSALVSGDPRHAVVHATLDAVNRRLETLLA